MDHNALGRSVSLSFLTFIQALNGIYLSLSAAGNKPTAPDLKRAIGGVNIAAWHFISSSINQIETFEQTLPMQLKLAESSRHRDVIRQLEHITQQATQQTIRTMRRGQLNVSHALAMSTGNALGQLVQQSVSKLQLGVKDRSNRKWRAPEKLVETIVRDYGYQSHIDAYLIQKKNQGIDLVQTPLGVISLMGNENYPSFAAVRPLIFHVNSRLMPEELIDVPTQS